MSSSLYCHKPDGLCCRAFTSTNVTSGDTRLLVPNCITVLKLEVTGHRTKLYLYLYTVRVATEYTPMTTIRCKQKLEVPSNN